MNQDILNAIARVDFCTFVKMVFREVAAGETLVPNWHIEAMCHALSEIGHGRRRRQIIEVPPRSLKSICASVALPAWLLGHNPTRKIMCVSYSQVLAADLAAKCRQVMKSKWYERLFPETRIRDKDTELYFRTSAGGFRDSTSVGGTLTGKGGDLIIIDDPGKPEAMISETQRRAVNDWYDRTLVSRLNNKARDAIVLVMQRLHCEDLVGHVQKQECWNVLRIPAIADAWGYYQLGPGRFYERQEGELLDPVREPLETLLALKAQMGAFAFSSQYQQNPIPIDGTVVEWGWFTRHDTVPAGAEIIQSWDCASKASEFSDYSVCTTWAVAGAKYYLIDVFRRKLLFPELLAAVTALADKWRPATILIEDSSSGTALVQQLKFSRPCRMPVPIAITPKSDKQTRLHLVSPLIEQGLVSLPQTAPWLDDFQTELLQFPYGRHDDQVDSMSQFLTRMDRLRRGSGCRAEQIPMFRWS